MINNNIEMIQGMKEPFDYEEYVSLCKKSSIPDVGLNAFIMGRGVIERAKYKYPDMDLQEAYRKVFQDIGEQDKAECCGEAVEDKPLPPLSQQMKNAGVAIVNHAKGGFKKADNYDERVAICESCEFLRSDKRCSKCGCFMKEKAKMAKEKCPINKW